MMAKATIVTSIDMTYDIPNTLLFKSGLCSAPIGQTRGPDYSPWSSLSSLAKNDALALVSVDFHYAFFDSQRPFECFRVAGNQGCIGLFDDAAAIPLS